MVFFSKIFFMFRDKLMATATMATAAGAAALLYYTLNRKLQTNRSGEYDNESGSNLSSNAPLGIERVSHRLIQAPATWLETISTLSETLRFTYSETLGKWPIGDLAFGINFLLKRQGHMHVASVFGGKDSIDLKGPDITAELRYLLNLLTLCWHFSKKPFPLFLEETGYDEEDVLLQEPKAGILKPAFTILVDHKTKCFLLLIRGTHSIKDTLTAATGAVVPFHHTVVQEGGVSDLVLGYAHCGMVAAARWIAKLATPCLIKALGKYPTYKIKVTASAWLNDLRNQIEHTRILSTVYRSASALGSRLPSIASAKAKVAGAGAILRPVSNGTQVVMRRAQSMAQAAWTRPAIKLSSWSCIGPRHRGTAAGSNSKEEGSSQESSPNKAETSEPLLTSPQRNSSSSTIENIGLPVSSGVEWTSENECSCSDEPHHDRDANLDDAEDLISHHSNGDRMNEVELWQQLEHELYDRTEGEEADVANQIREEEAAAIAEVGEGQPASSVPETKEVHRFFPAGKIMHIVTLHSDAVEWEGDPSTSIDTDNGQRTMETRIGIFLTPRSLYSKLRLSQTMISDHFMPIYRRQIEKLIKELEEDQALNDQNHGGYTGEVVS
ncbi:uncharacterized protein LOC111279021 isoform X6 [Durio zibethinus]|uniref:Uncharacterized protein LOC111279021 isoform X6 n=1 Tax=Durio zibethinus TaxID=66656 RepID=A0A6P5WZX3_DURZI|nr:uncharacterized protein LOC111279021 isoform X6 [Durio zibethinus]